MPRNLSPEIVAKHQEFVRLHSDGHHIPNRIRVHEMPDETFRDLIGGTRVRPWKSGDGNPLHTCPISMQTWTLRDTDAGETLGFYFVDARVRIVCEPWFSLSEVLYVSSSHWSAPMKSRYPGAIPTSGFLPARF